MMANEDDTKRPFVSFTAYDEYGNELTSTIEFQVFSNAEAIEIWQRIREFLRKISGNDSI